MKNIFVSIFIFLFIRSFSFSQTDDQKIVTEILSVWKDKGEEGLKDYAKKNENKINIDFIRNLSKKGLNDRKEEILNVAHLLAKEKNENKLLADVVFNFGQYYYSIAKDDNAWSLFKQALSIYIEIKDTIGQGNVYKREGDIYYYTGKKKEALEMYEKALPLFQKANDFVGQGNVYKSEGDLYLNTGDNRKALELFDKALLLFKQTSNSVGQATVYQSEGDIYVRTGETRKAMEMYESALPLYQKADDLIGQGSVYRREGDTYYLTGENEKALEMYENAIPFFQKANSSLGLGNVYKSKGDIYLRIGENKKALEMYEKALSLYQKTNSPIGQANSYKAKGDIYIDTGENEKALEMFEKALPLYQKVDDPLGLGNIYRKEGEIYLNTGENQKALEMFEKALLFYQKINASLGLGNVYRCEGDIYSYNGDYNKALENYDIALPFYQKANEPIGEGNVYRCKGDVFLKTGEYQKAMEMFEKALPLLQKGNSFTGLGNLYRSKGDGCMKSGNKLKALEMYEKAFEYFDKGGYISNQASTLFRKARAINDKNTQANYYNTAIQLLEKIRSNTGLSESKKSYMQSIYSDYEEAALFMLKNGYKDTSFMFIEGLKARTFLDLLAEKKADIDNGITPEQKQKREELENKLSKLNKNRTLEYSKDPFDPQIINLLEKDIAKYENELDEVKKQIRLSNPKYASVKYPQAVTIKELQDSILKKDEVILEYFLSKAGCFITLIAKDLFEIIKIDSNYEKIETDCNIYLSDLRDPVGLKGNKISINAGKHSEYLYKTLIAPLIKYIDGKNLIIIPDGVLACLPFEAIITDKGKYLIENFKIKYVQSATILNLLRTQYKKSGLTDWFVGFGDPVYDYENWKNKLNEDGTDEKSLNKGSSSRDITRSRFLRANGRLNRLVGSGIEVMDIGNLFGKNGTIFTREKATEEKAKEDALSKYTYIHFSTHGILDDNFQAIALSQIPDSIDDGFLTFDKIMNSKYTNAKLVVLSACQTGLGKEEKGEGVTGLTRAVMYAGSPAATVSLWSVSDEGTKDFMISFYKNMLNDKMSKDEALRETKLSMIKSDKYFLPFFWAAFVMYGE
jgi:CHAT domain-containing protein/predicted negative regulator of RcsB-dependent stress response